MPYARVCLVTTCAQNCNSLPLGPVNPSERKSWNNILIHTGTRGSIEIDSSSQPGFISDYNVVNNRFARNETFITLAQWRALGYDPRSILNPGLATLFVNPTAANYHLRTESPAINAGVAVTGVVNDLDGNPRPQGLRYDIGADEALIP
ncbi:MAG: hypothetical protein EXR78_08480 [Deltaproteobacteria bacterium]|nr:hypothetical protein [Deltaproteobacteria bacterium]